MNETARTWGEAASEREEKNYDKKCTPSESAELVYVKSMSLERNSSGCDKYDNGWEKMSAKMNTMFACIILAICQDSIKISERSYWKWKFLTEEI